MANKLLKLNIDYKPGSKSENEGSFTLQPLERGYGTTLGNAFDGFYLQVFLEQQ